MCPFGGLADRPGLERFPVFIPPRFGIERLGTAARAAFTPIAGVPNRIKQRDRQTTDGIEKIDFGLRIGVIYFVESAEIKGAHRFYFHSLAASPSSDAVEV